MHILIMPFRFSSLSCKHKGNKSVMFLSLQKAKEHIDLSKVKTGASKNL